VNQLVSSPATRRLALATAAFVVCAGLVAVVARDDTLRPGEVRLTVESGRAEIERAGGGLETVTRTAMLRTDDEVRVIEGTAHLELAGGARLEGRDARRAAGGVGGTELRIGPRIALLRGEMLAMAANGVSVDVAGTAVDLLPSPAGEAAARLARGYAVRVGVFRGEAVLDSAGQTRSIRALRRMDVPVLGRPPRLPRPLGVDPADPWDVRFLGAAITLGEQLDAKAAAFTSGLRDGRGRDADFYRTLLPDLAADGELQALLDQQRGRDQGELVVGAAISTLGQRASFRDRWRSVFEFRDAGADWGIVALDQGVTRDPLPATVPPASPGGDTGDGTGDGPGDGSDSGPDGDGGPPNGDGTPSPPTTSPPGSTPPVTAPPTTPPPTTPPPPGLIPETGVPEIDGLVDPVDELLCGIVGGTGCRPP
jgi:hypothetical protein